MKANKLFFADGMMMSAERALAYAIETNDDAFAREVRRYMRARAKASKIQRREFFASIAA